MIVLSHFLNMSKSKGNKVILCNEAFTSKTCGNCGFLQEYNYCN
jgi:transposase